MNKLAYSLIFASLLFMPIFTVDAAVLRTPPNNLGLVGYWSMEDGSGSTATDFSGSGNAGTLTNMDPGSDWVNGKRGRALDFDGSDDYIEVPDPDDFNFGPAFNITVSTWVKTQRNYDCGTNSDNKVVLGYRAGTPQWWLGCNQSTDQVRWSVRGSDNNINEIVGKSKINDGRWHHIVGRLDNSTDQTAIFVDGKKETEEALTITGDLSGSTPLCVGVYGQGCTGFSSTHWDGNIDEARVYNRALSGSEIKDLYQSGYAQVNRTAKVEEVGDPVGWWAMDGKDIDWSASSNEVKDLSANANDGTLNGGMSNTDGVPGRIGQALKFDDSNDYVSVNTGSLPQGTSDYAVSAWFKAPEDKGDIFFWGTGSANEAAGLVIREDPQRVGHALWDNDLYVNQTYDDGGWHHLVGVHDNSKEKILLYFDGKKIGNSTENPNIGSTFAAIGVNNWSGGPSNFYQGKIDDVRIYDKALSADEIQKLYDATRPSEVNASQNDELTDGLVGMWSFDGPSMDFSGSPSTAADVSSNSNTATLNGDMASAIGNVGQALEFDGADDYIGVGDVGSGLQTVSFWIKPKSDNEKVLELNSGSGGSSLRNNLVSWWDMEESATSTRSDSAGSNDLTPQNGETADYPAQKPGIVGKAAEVSGSNAAWLENTSADSLDPAGDYSVAMWVYADSSVGPFNPFYLLTGYSNDLSADSTRIKINISAAWDTTDYYLRGTQATWSNTPGIGGPWHLLVARYDASEDQMTFDTRATNDGSFTTNTASQASGDRTDEIYFGSYDDPGGRGNEVRIDSVGWWHKELSDTELDELYNSGNGVSYLDISGPPPANIEISGSDVITSGFSNQTVYVDGQVDSSITAGEWQHVVISTDSGIDASATKIGEVAGAYLDGKIDNVRIYDRALSADEVKRLYRLGQ